MAKAPRRRRRKRDSFGGQSDVQKKPFTAEDIRFTQSKDGKTLYAIVLAFPADGKVTIKSLAGSSETWPGKIGNVRLLGGLRQIEIHPRRKRIARHASGKTALPDRFRA